jgi:hypothetical protein
MTTAAFEQFAHLVIVHTEGGALWEHLFGKLKKNKNVIVVTYDSVLPRKLKVVTEHTIPVKLLPAHRMPPRYSQSLTPVTVAAVRMSAAGRNSGGDFNAGVAHELLHPEDESTKIFRKSGAVTRKVHSNLLQTSLLEYAATVPYCPLYRTVGRQCARANTEGMYVVTVIMYRVGNCTAVTAEGT